jgi:hypothetical protein
MMFPVGRYNRAAVAFIALTLVPAQGQGRFGIKHFCGLQYPRLAQLGVYSATVRLLAVIGDDGSVKECRELPVKSCSVPLRWDRSESGALKPALKRHPLVRPKLIYFPATSGAAQAIIG